MYYNYKLSDESVNSKGFVVLTDGIDLAKFNDNPVALHNHNINVVVGNWENVRIDEENPENLVGTLVFDYSDPKAQELMNQVSKNLIKHVSIGIKIIEFYDDIINDQEVIVISKSELKEASITPLPANENAIKLTYNGETVDDIVEFTKKNKNNMSKVLELTEKVNELENEYKESKKKYDSIELINKDLIASVELKDKEISDLNTQVEELNSKLEDIAKAEQEAKFNSLLNDAIEDGKINDEQKENFLKLTFDNAKAIIDGLSSKVIKPEVKLSDMVKDEVKKEEVKDFNWYKKNDPVALNSLYLTDRTAYNNLYDGIK